MPVLGGLVYWKHVVKTQVCIYIVDGEHNRLYDFMYTMVVAFNDTTQTIAL